VQAFINHLLADGLAPRTVQYAHAILRAALNKAVKWGLVARNVATLVDTPGLSQQEMQFLAPEEARQFLEAIRGDRLEALYTVALAIGLRPGEALGLRWQDVHLDTGILTVQVALQRVEGVAQLVELKTRRSRRSLTLPPFAVAALKAHRARQDEEREFAGSMWEDRDLVFTTRRGRPLGPRNVIRSFRRMLKRAKLTHRRLYDLRHTCASLLLVQGVHPRVVMDILGHSQISLTMNTYSHVIPELQQEAATRIDDLLKGTS
jgi:integrase